MKHATTQHPLFPLSAHVLPGGRMSLRIFEPRYVRMVKEACAGNSGFVVCMLDATADKQSNQHIYPIGTYCRVIDFELLDDGLLGITVEGETCVRVSNVVTERDGLRVGDCHQIDPWQYAADVADIAKMNMRLREIFEKYPEVNELYTTPQFDDPVWVIYRWLELLPVNAAQKQHFLQQESCDKAVQFLNQLVE